MTDAIQDIVMTFPTQLKYVSPGGSDVTGTGAIDNPYQTISFAMSTCGSASVTNPFFIMAVGIFNESVALLPNVSIVGIAPTCQITGIITNAGAWDTAATASISYLMNLTIGGLTFTPAPANKVRLSLLNVITMTNSVTINSTTANYLVCYITGCIFNFAVGISVNYDGALIYSENNGYLIPVKIGFNSTSASVSVTSKSDAYYNQSSIAVTTSGNAGILYLFGSQIITTSFTGANNAKIFIDSVCPLPTLSGSAAFIFLSKSTAVAGVYTPVHYTPTNSSVDGYLQGIDNAFGVLSTTARSGVVTVVQNTNYTITNPAPNTLKITLQSPALTVTLPPVSSTSLQTIAVGDQIIIQNLSTTNAFNINKSDATFLVALPAWNQIRLVLNSNGTAAGTWSFFITPLDAPAIINTTTIQLTPNVRYLLTNASPVTATLPTAANVGDFIEIGNGGGSLFTVAANGGQTIRFGNQPASSSIASLDVYASLKLVCIVQNTTFMVFSPDGNFSV